MKSVTIIFPHQLFREHPALEKDSLVLIVEEKLYFTQFAFHKKKLILHRASMKYYADHLKAKGFPVRYIAFTEQAADVRILINILRDEKVTEIKVAEMVDDWLGRRVNEAASKAGIQLTIVPTPSFITDIGEAKDYFSKRKTYFQTDFYIWQRKKRKLLTDPMNQPLGGKWSYDAENRERFPKGGKIPPMPWKRHNVYVNEAVDYVRKHFPDNPGSADGFGYPVTFDEANDWLDHFLEHRLAGFGPYEDSMVPSENFLFHSVLTPMLNIGLLEPAQIINRVLSYASSHQTPMNSLEGFIRQVVGWREFIRVVYELEGRKQRTTNHFGFTRKIPKEFWTGLTSILPVDTVIRHTLNDGYTHHINRLMILGNFMLLCEFDPDEVYRWFHEMYVDGYDWVMVPNVYGMTQFADGGLMTTKPYISGSNYIMKMGSWQKGPWQQIWDALFWRFMHVHRDLMSKNPRLGMLLNTFDKMDKEKKTNLLSTAEYYLASLDS